MFKLFFYKTTSPMNVFSSSELSNCLDYITQNKLCPQMCLIITPNGRQITFNQNNSIIFSEFVVA